MRARIWGCRGSLATPGEATVRYGGNTSCVELHAPGGGLVILDAGTGIRGLGHVVHGNGVRDADLLMTHLHLDHVEGLGFFEPLFDPEFTLRVWGPRPDGGTLKQQLSVYLSPPFFPMAFDEIPATIEFTEVERDRWSIAGMDVTTAPVHHRGRTVGYRLEEGSRSMAFIPDNEPGLDRESGLELAAGAEVLFHDAQYTADEYRTRVGWGHTSLPDYAAYLNAAAPGRAVMFHHDPEHSDDELEKMRTLACELAGRDGIELAHEGMVVELE